MSEAELLADPELSRLDPELASVRGVDTPEDYARARREPVPAVLVTSLTDGVREARVATLGAAAEAAGLRLGPAATVTINDHLVSDDPRQPLVAGDRVGFRPAGGAPFIRAIHPGSPGVRGTA